MLFTVADSLGFDEIAFNREITLITFPSTTGTTYNQIIIIIWEIMSDEKEMTGIKVQSFYPSC